MLTVRRNKKDTNWDDYGENWFEIREKVLERDNYTCQRCGKEEDECSSLQVHHETPVKEFDSPEKANKLENLATYCGNCHQIKEMESWIRETKQEAET